MKDAILWMIENSRAMEREIEGIKVPKTNTVDKNWK
jgi:hypothetical protein